MNGLDNKSTGQDKLPELLSEEFLTVSLYPESVPLGRPAANTVDIYMCERSKKKLVSARSDWPNMVGS